MRSVLIKLMTGANDASIDVGVVKGEGVASISHGEPQGRFSCAFTRMHTRCESCQSSYHSCRPCLCDPSVVGAQWCWRCEDDTTFTQGGPQFPSLLSCAWVSEGRRCWMCECRGRLAIAVIMQLYV
jgi:hypothetical protein